MKILITGITDSGILRVRSELIKALQEEGHSITVVTPPSNVFPKLEELGCSFIPISIDAHGLNPVKDLMVVMKYRKILNQVKPDVVLSFTIKPNLYCGINCRLKSIPQVMNITGFGTLAYPGIKQDFLVNLYRVAAKKVKLIFFQNQSNLNHFKNWHIASERQYQLIPGSGVNLNQYTLQPYPDDSNGIHFLFVSRILKEKGIDNYLDAARVIHDKYPNTYFHILGHATGEYADKVSKANEAGCVIYHGRVNNVPDFQKMSHCTVLPSYYPEGICNVLLEAAASGRPVITCDHSGCRETVDNGETGYLVRPNDTKDLISKLEAFMALSNSQRSEMGQAGRKKMEREFDRQIVTNAYMQVVKEVAEQSKK